LGLLTFKKFFQLQALSLVQVQLLAYTFHSPIDSELPQATLRGALIATAPPGLGRGCSRRCRRRGDSSGREETNSQSQGEE
jgi:hypothetical protein